MSPRKPAEETSTGLSLVRPQATGPYGSHLERVRTLLERYPEQLNSVGLAHVTDVGEQVLFTRAFEKKKAGTDPDYLNTIAEDVISSAFADVEAYRMPQRYVAIAYRGEEVLGSSTFQIRPPMSNDVGGETEPANATGLVAQAQRHLETKERMAYSAIDGVLSRLQEENDRLRADNTRLTNGWMNMLQHQEELISQKHKRDLEMKEAEAMSARIDKLFEHIDKRLLPALIAKYTPNGGPVKAMFDSLKPEQLAQIHAVLTEEQRLMLTQLAEIADNASAAKELPA